LPDSESGAEAWLKLNARLSEVWPNITQRRDPLNEADAMQDKKDKFETFFTEAPGEGN
jgi:ferredoxin